MEVEGVLNKFQKCLIDDDNYKILKDFEVRDDDVFVIGIPKSGTTWAQEMVWLIAHDLDFEGSKVFIDERFPNLEIGLVVSDIQNENLHIPECHQDSIKYVENMKSPRFIKSHLGPKALPDQILSGEKKPKIIYVARKVQDVCLSAYYFSKNLLKVTKFSLDDFCKLCMTDYSPLRNYWESVLYFWKLRHEDNVLFIRYEEMKENLSNVIQKVANFFGKSLTEEQTATLIKWLHFDSFKNNPAINHENVYQEKGFIREGKVGGYKTEMSPEIQALFDIWIEKSIKDTDYKQ